MLPGLSLRQPLRAGTLAAAVALAAALGTIPARASSTGSFAEFESLQTRPLALSPDGSRLYAVNTPDDRLEIFDVDAAGLHHAGSVPVGLEPVAVAARPNGQVWVVNLLSDSVSIVDATATPPRVVRTLLVGDEPRDIVFAGPGAGRAFVTTAHRGQNGPIDPQLTTPGIGRADVWVFDADAPGTTLEGTPIEILSLFGDSPGALAATPDGSTVYGAVLLSGNRSTTIHEGAIPDGDLPPPRDDADGVPAPETGLIVRYDGAHWVDGLGRTWDSAVKFSLPDEDVFAIDAMADPPHETAAYSGVGTVLFGMAVNPVNGKLYVSNTEAQNDIRFEGPGIRGGSTVRGRTHLSRITVIGSSTVLPRHLNKHLDPASPTASPADNAKSLSLPQGMAVTPDGATLFVAAFGSGEIGVFDTAELEGDTFVPSASSHIAVSGGGPSGLVLDTAHGRLYVLTRFDDAVSVIDVASRLEIAHHPLHNPEPASIVNGRPLFYDAHYTSSRGDGSCAVCHVSGDFDGLAWDLGNPDASVLHNPNPFELGPDPTTMQDFHPVKGPMTTQTLRGLAHGGPMHWRGDRTGGNDPGGDPLDENAALLKFNVAFVDLVGREAPLPQAEMQAMTDFLLQICHPPNPIRSLDDSLTAAEQRGSDFYFTQPVRTDKTCNDCHTLDPVAGNFGTHGLMASVGETQNFKIPQLRDMYRKVGMFGMPSVLQILPGDNDFMGDQIRGFGFIHDGSVDTLLRFHRHRVFSFPGGDAQRQDVDAFVMAYPSESAPILGQQVTLTSTNAAVAGPRIDLLIARSAVTSPVPECDLVVKGVTGGEARGWYRTAAGTFRSDRASEPLLSDVDLRALAATASQELTYTCVPPGSGERIGVDRDEDGFFDRDETDAGSDPADAASTPSDTDGDGTPNASDCAPEDPWSYPGALEVCDGNDNDCDGTVPADEIDGDGDGWVACLDWSDGQGDQPQILGGGDCGPADPGTFPGAPETCDGVDQDCSGVADDNVAPPAGVPDLDLSKVPGATSLMWTTVPGSTGYDVVQGRLTPLSETGSLSSSVSACLADDDAGTSIDDPEIPMLGGGFWYLVRPRNCGGPGTFDTMGPSQEAPRDGQIAQSPDACP